MVAFDCKHTFIMIRKYYMHDFNSLKFVEIFIYDPMYVYFL